MSGDQTWLCDRLHCSAPWLPHPQVQAVCSVTWMEAQVLLQRPAPSPHRPSITATSRTRVLEAEHRRELPGEVEQPPEQRWTYSRNSNIFSITPALIQPFIKILTLNIFWSRALSSVPCHNIEILKYACCSMVPAWCPPVCNVNVFVVEFIL